MTLSRRRARGPCPVELELLPSVCLDTASCARLLRDIVKHIMYMRGQIPALYDHLVNQNFDHQVQYKRRSSREQKSVAALSALLGSITEALFHTGVTTTCVLALGRSLARPRETLTLRFWPGEGRSQPGTDAGGLSRTALRQLLLQLGAHESAVQGACRLFLLVRPESIAGHAADRPAAAPPPGFVPRRAGLPAQRRGLACSARVGAESSGTDAEGGNHVGLQVPWFQATAIVKGVTGAA